jgi:hypothetical protein
MTTKEKEHCYTTLLGKINSLDNQINRVRDQIKELKKIIGTHTSDTTDTVETAQAYIENASELISNEES